MSAVFFMTISRYDIDLGSGGRGDSAARTRRNPSLNDSTTDGRKDNEWVAPVNQLSSLKSITAANSGARKIP